MLQAGFALRVLETARGKIVIQTLSQI